MRRPGGHGPILLFGAGGQVGSALLTGLADAFGSNLIVPDRARADFASPESVREIIRQTRPTLIVNAAAYTAVDAAESDRELAFLVNRETPTAIAEEASKYGAFFIHYSTDYVFDGQGSQPYKEGDPAAPVNVYGESKLAGEHGVAAASDRYIIFRTSWVYADQGRNFLNAMRGLAETKTELRIVSDQTGCPTWAGAIAEATLEAITLITGNAEEKRDFSGIYHLCATGHTTWAGFAKAIFERICLEPPRIIPISTEEYALPAPRPRYTVLDTTRAEECFAIRMPSWERQLDDCLSSSKIPTN